MLNVKQLFDVDFPAALAKNAEAGARIGHLYQFKVGGEGGGEWSLNLKKDNGGPYCKAGFDDNNECCIEFDSVATLNYCSESWQSNLLEKYFSNKITVKGNQMLLMKLQRVFEISKDLLK